MVETINKLSRFQRQLTLELNREPTDEELAAKMGMSPEKIREVIKIAQDPVSSKLNWRRRRFTFG